MTFINNTATQLGGAIYVTPGTAPSIVLNGFHSSCFYQLLNCCANSTYMFVFEGNSAPNGGDDIYGVSLVENSTSCSSNAPCTLDIKGSSSKNSSISSDPLRVCILCDDNGKPQCENISYTFMSYSVHPGEIFTLSFVLVGGDFGLTIGTVFANINYQSTNYLSTPSLSPDTGQPISSISTCTKVRYSLYSQSNSSMTVLFTTTALTYYQSLINDYYDGCDFTADRSCFLHSPTIIDFTILPCPPGFTLLDKPQRCDCYPVLTDTLNVT